MGSNEDDDNTSREESRGAKISGMVRDCVEALKGGHSKAEKGGLLQIEGIFRVSPSNALLRAAKYAYRLNQRPNLAPFVEKDAHLPAALLKDYLRSLPSPFFPWSVYPLIERCPTASDEETVQYIRRVLLPTLSEEKMYLLTYVLQCLHEASLRSEINRMDASNLSVVFTPNLVHSDDIIKDMMMCRVQKSSGSSEEDGLEERNKATLGTIVAFCIEHYYEVFDEVDYDLPMLHFHEDERERRDRHDQSAAWTTRSRKDVVSGAGRQGHGSPTRKSDVGTTTTSEGGFPLATPPSPSTNTHTTLRSTNNSLRVKNRLLSGGSFRGGGLTTIEKANESVAVVGTSALGEFEMGGEAAAALGTTSSSSSINGEVMAAISSPKKVSSSSFASPASLSAPFAYTTQDDNASSHHHNHQHNPAPDPTPPSPTTLQARKAGKQLGLISPRLDRRPLSGVFEE
jgi:hypothetical protein